MARISGYLKIRFETVLIANGTLLLTQARFVVLVIPQHTRGNRRCGGDREAPVAVPETRRQKALADGIAGLKKLLPGEMLDMAALKVEPSRRLGPDPDGEGRHKIWRGLSGNGDARREARRQGGRASEGQARAVGTAVARDCRAGGQMARCRSRRRGLAAESGQRAAPYRPDPDVFHHVSRCRETAFAWHGSHPGSEPPQVYRSAFCSIIRQPYRVCSGLRRTPPLLLRAGVSDGSRRRRSLYQSIHFNVSYSTLRIDFHGPIWLMTSVLKGPMTHSARTLS